MSRNHLLEKRYGVADNSIECHDEQLQKDLAFIKCVHRLKISTLFCPVYQSQAVAAHMQSKVEGRKGRGDVRIDRISDGSLACGFVWTWTSGNEEGLRGTTFVELNASGKIQYVREIPEPLFKPGDATLELLKAVTKGAEPKPKPEFQSRTPTIASELAKYLFLEVQGGDIDESMRLFDETILYRDFNYEEILDGKAEVRKFIEDFSFPGIEFRPERFDDGVDSTCFTWDVCLAGQEETVKGISFYELEPDTRLVSYGEYPYFRETA